MPASTVPEIIAEMRAWAAADVDLMLVMTTGHKRLILFKPDIDDRTDEELATLIRGSHRIME